MGGQKKVVVDHAKIKQESVFNMTELYKSFFAWFANYGYDFAEDEYNEKDNGKNKDLKIFWSAEKKVDAYIKWGISFDVLILGLENVEIERNGLKLKTNKCSIEIKITSYMIKDYDDKWSKGFVAVFRKLYDKVVAHHRYVRMEEELIRETNKLIDELKAFLNLYQA
ncbi:MAG TPA: hypothetical protein VJH37_05075 [Candidatus Nanoarchaeia archaeon]|nr:hypothetical protein [Candidatus Nanoarchaeia archaeon]